MEEVKTLAWSSVAATEGFPVDEVNDSDQGSQLGAPQERNHCLPNNLAEEDPYLASEQPAGAESQDQHCPMTLE